MINADQVSPYMRRLGPSVDAVHPTIFNFNPKGRNSQCFRIGTRGHSDNSYCEQSLHHRASIYVPNLNFKVLAEINKDSTPREAINARSLRLTDYVLWPTAALHNCDSRLIKRPLYACDFNRPMHLDPEQTANILKAHMIK